MQAARNRPHLFEGVAGQQRNAVQGLLGGGRRVGDRGGDCIELQANGSQQLANSGVQLTPQALPLPLHVLNQLPRTGAAAPPFHPVGNIPLRLLQVKVVPQKPAFQMAQSEGSRMGGGFRLWERLQPQPDALRQIEQARHGPPSRARRESVGQAGPGSQHAIGARALPQNAPKTVAFREDWQGRRLVDGGIGFRANVQPEFSCGKGSCLNRMAGSLTSGNSVTYLVRYSQTVVLARDSGKVL